MAIKIGDANAVNGAESVCEQEGRRLTNRELDVLGHVARGLSNKQIAGRLSLSENTVRNHLAHIFGKLEACNRTQAVITAMRSGLQIWQ